MKNIIEIFLVLIFAYLIGSIPTSVWVGKIFFNLDVRDFGSGNAGATNVMRVLGPAVGVPVLLIDILKGFLAVRVLNIFPDFVPGGAKFVNMQIALGVAAVVGHIYPVYAGFRGGKGVATIFGVLLALSPLATFCAGGVFLIVLFISKYVSISSIAAGLSFPLWIVAVFQTTFLSLGIFSGAVAFLIILTHRKNILRLISGTENKASFLFKEKRPH
jgi:acyl phosphate:glycerol-3-phosphate acyltransferase